MRLTQEQIKELEPFEHHFTTAIRSRYARYPGQMALQKIHAIYSSVVPTAPKLNTSCSQCVFRLILDTATIYFADKEEMEKQVVEEPKKKTTRKKK